MFERGVVEPGPGGCHHHLILRTFRRRLVWHRRAIERIGPCDIERRSA
ncbi:hypothetical protein JDM601_4177 [Mycolicibacter sinensis]|uniref:Uncharacterized protein n=1 Tax=Mycolicibacter sinensis (strain JDM601) TaxID=875328 RepID=F5YUF4_MYCSD|nr:hypothetical protein JDM601_4177 [Mycolicibacter sinensis]